MKKITGKEFMGSAGIALALYTGALAMQQQESAARDAAAAATFQHEHDISSESGAAGMAYAETEAYQGARAEYKRDMSGAIELGAFAAIMLGAGLSSLGQEAKKDSRKRTSLVPQPGPAPAAHVSYDATEPLAAYGMPVPKAYPIDDATQRIERVVIPVPRPEVTGVAKHRVA